MNPHPLDDHATSQRRGQFGSRGFCLCLVGGLLLVGLMFYAGASRAIVMYRLVVDGGYGLAWVLAAVGLGIWLYRFIVGDDKDDPAHLALVFATSAAAGIGLIGLLVLMLGLIGWLNGFTAVGIVIAGLLAGAMDRIRHASLGSIRNYLAGRATWGWLWLLVVPLGIIVVVAAFFPPGILWGEEPNGYDVVEYHLQVPRQWFELGRIVPLHQNVFSYFPFNVEMHYLLAMHLRGGPWAGMYLAQLMSLAMAVLAVVAVFGAAGGGRRGSFAAFAMAVTPWLSLVAPIAYVESGLILFSTLALAWTIRALRGGNSRQWILAGLMAGLACGVKYSAVPILLIAVPAAVAAAGLISFNRRNLPAETKGVALYLLAAVVVFSPWLIRNWVWSGNPVFPEAMSLLGQAHFSDVQVERWRIANHLPDVAHRSVIGRILAAKEQIVWDWRYGYILLPLALAAAIINWRKSPSQFLVILLLLMSIFWICFTHLQSRFFILALPIAALLIGQLESMPMTIVSAIYLGVMAIVSTVAMQSQIWRFMLSDQVMHEQSNIGWIGLGNLTGLRPGDPKADHIWLVGDGNVFWYTLPMSRLGYKTVFDVDTSDRGKDIAQDWIDGPFAPTEKNQYIIAASELDRFHRTYFGIPSLPDSWKHETRRGVIFIK